MRLPLMYGLKHNRWAKSIGVILEKKAGLKKIHLLRIIELVGADINTSLKSYLAKHPVSNLEKTELTDEQWVSCPGWQASDPVLYNMLPFKYGRALYML